LVWSAVCNKQKPKRKTTPEREKGISSQGIKGRPLANGDY
jgi:hypothetical protein